VSEERNGFPQIVFLPGLHGSAALYGPFFAQIPARYRPVLIEYPQDQPLKYDELFEMIMHRTSEIPRMIVIAESFSGPLGVRLADVAPDRVVALVLSVTFVRCPLPRWFVRFSQFMAGITRPPRFQVRLQLTGWDAPRELVDEMQSASAEADKPVMAARIAAVAEMDVTQTLARTRTPLLYLQAEFDRLIPARNAALIQQIRPDTKLVKLPTPHLLLRVAPREAWQAIEQFLRSVHVVAE
jgi:pimeloyl-ACP methyl ester carboxylesterase